MMATLHAGPASCTPGQAERRFFLIMALAMALVTVSGFILNLAMGRSSFAAPAAYHFHGVVFMGWLALYLAQAVTIATGRRELHIRLVSTLIFPAIATVDDQRRHGRVHPANLWGTGVYVPTFLGSMLLAINPVGFTM